MNYLKISLITLLLIGILFSCKKNSAPEPKDYTASIKDKTWWGELTYTGKATEIYCVHFNSDNTLVWGQLSGDYTGKWRLNSDILTMTFDANTAEITATVTNDDRLANILDNTSFYEINSGTKIQNPNTQLLDNTKWKGMVTDVSNTVNPLPLEVNFEANQKFKTNFVSTGSTYSYTRSSSGARDQDAV